MNFQVGKSACHGCAEMPLAAGEKGVKISLDLASKTNYLSTFTLQITSPSKFPCYRR